MNDKYCSNCGELLVPGSKFCSGCGRPVNQGAANYGQNSGYNAGYNNNYSGNRNTYNAPPVQQNQYYQQPIQTPVSRNKPTKKEYRKVCANPDYRKGLKNTAIWLYVLTVANALIAVASNPWGLVDAGIYMVLTLGMHLSKSKACAFGILGMAIFNAAYLMMETGKFGGYLWILMGIAAIRAFSVADKEYESIYGK